MSAAANWEDERDRILEADGFDDIEYRNGNIVANNLVGDAAVSRAGRAWALEDIAAHTEYYRMAGKYLHAHHFKNVVEKRIWELHSEGASVARIRTTVRREIAADKLPSGVRVYHKKVHYIIARHRRCMFGERIQKRRRGPKADPHALYRTGVALHVRMSPGVLMAMDHIRTVMPDLTTAEIARRGILLLAKVTK